MSNAMTHVFGSERVSVRDEHVAFEALDARGRVIGAHVRVWEIQGVLPDPTAQYRVPYLSRGGSWFRVVVQATRNGASYGAAQSAQTFETLDEALAFAEKRLAASRKAAAKKARA